MRDTELFAQPTIVAGTVEHMPNYMLLAIGRPSLKLMVPSELSSLSGLAPSPALAPLHVTVDFLFWLNCKLLEDECSLLHLVFITFTVIIDPY